MSIRIFSAMLLLGVSAPRAVSQLPEAARDSIVQRYHGDTLWLSGTGARAGFVQRQVFSSGLEHAPDTIAVAWMHLDSLKQLDTYLFEDDSTWVLRAGQRQALSGRAAIFPHALFIGWRAHHERISTVPLERP